MCGISGVAKFNGVSQKEEKEIIRFNRIQKHRGPDDEGVWSSKNCVLGHVRLSIIDLSVDGHEPFISENGRYCLVYNGEIYNYIELRSELISKGYSFRTKTDTEVLLKCFEEYGVECLNYFNGMFAFAIYDNTKKELFVARDRFGIKPFYYRITNNAFYFASEIKALRSLNLPCHIDDAALFDYLCFNRTDIQDETFIKEIKRLPKGYYGFFNQDGLKMYNWWDARKFIGKHADIAEKELEKLVAETMVSVVQLRMRSDVTIGSCLSGGLDSSIILGIIDKNFHKENYKTFTAVFPGYRLDETRYVDLLKRRFNIQNYQITPTAEMAFKNFFEFSDTNDEPVTSPTFYSQYEVMRLAHEQKVTVLLDGQGGDEIFAGYQYFHGFNFTGLWNQKKYYSLFSELLNCLIRQQDIEALETFAFQILPANIRKKLLINTLPHIKKEYFYDHVGQSSIYNEFFSSADLDQSIANHFRFKLEHLLRTEDRNSMAFQIEARLPYLDYRLVELMLGVPAKIKIQQGENKRIQKKALGDYTIPEILERKDKIGFGTPGEEWMQNPAWEKLTIKNYQYLCDVLPNIFSPGARIKNNLYDKWKINQLANWHQKLTVKI